MDWGTPGYQCRVRSPSSTPGLGRAPGRVRPRHRRPRRPRMSHRRARTYTRRNPLVCSTFNLAEWGAEGVPAVVDQVDEVAPLRTLHGVERLNNPVCGQLRARVRERSGRIGCPEKGIGLQRRARPRRRSYARLIIGATRDPYLDSREQPRSQRRQPNRDSMCFARRSETSHSGPALRSRPADIQALVARINEHVRSNASVYGRDDGCFSGGRSRCAIDGPAIPPRHCQQPGRGQDSQTHAQRREVHGVGNPLTE